MTRQAQATLEFALVFIIIAALILGLLSLWAWSKNNIGGRWGAFEDTRVQAGTKASPGEPPTPFHAVSPAEPRLL